MRKNNKGHHLWAVRLDSVSVNSKSMRWCSDCFFQACWHMLSFIASESTLAAIPWDIRASQWLNTHCTLAALGISHSLPWAMLNVAKKMLLCWWGHSSHLRCTQRPCQAELDTPAWPSEQTRLMELEEETEEKKKWSSKVLLYVQNTSFDSWASTFYQTWSCMCTEQWDTAQSKAALNHISKISAGLEGPQSHCLSAASTTFNSHQLQVLQVGKT